MSSSAQGPWLAPVRIGASAYPAPSTKNAEDPNQKACQSMLAMTPTMSITAGLKSA